MELKLKIIIKQKTLNWVLIVPYGIETLFLLMKMVLFLVLIVPYGIETSLEASNIDLAKSC